jgi:hypothetical protein
MKFSTLVMTSVLAIGLSGVAFAQEEPGFGGHGSVSKNQQPGPQVNNPTDPAAGNPNSPAQTPTDPNKQKNLQYKGASGAGPGNTGSDLPPPPPPQ